MRVSCLLVLVYMLPAAALLASEPLAAAGASRSSRLSAVDSLRQAWGLSTNVDIEWRTSSVATDTISVVDHFNRATLGQDWAADSRYWAIKNGELVLSPEANSEWRYLAVFTKIANDVENKIFSVSYRWGAKADALGIGEGAHALMLSKPDVDADGYWCWRRTNQKQVWLYAIKNGIWEYSPGQSKEYDTADARTPVPRAGDEVEVTPHKEDDGMYFDYYVNGQYDATVVDGSKEFADNFPWYAGVFIHGQSLNNPIDDFRVTVTAQDAIAPARITDLNARDATQTAITLEWTATGDNDYSGRATRYEMRYSSSPISTQNFGTAQLLANAPIPGDPGQRQQVTVGGLQVAQLYYFAMRVFDEVGNVSGLSNILEARTKDASVATELQLVEGCGQTGEVGKPLVQKLVAKVLDQFGGAVMNRNVRFVIIAGGGNVQGSTNLVVPTDANGRAAVVWTLGTTPGQNKLEIRSSGLTGSPIACSANAVTGSAAVIAVTSQHRTLYSVNTVSEAIALRITDAVGNPAAGSVINFSVSAGAGFFVNGVLPARKTLQAQADANGAARVTVNTGSVFGDTTRIAVIVESLAGPIRLATPLFVIAAPPDSMKAVSGNQQSGLLNTALPDPLQVQIFDATGAPAAGHAVTFAILSGTARLGSGVTQLETATDGQGYAKAAVKLGPLPGNNQIQVRSQFKGKDLRRSPVVFTAFAVTGTISASLSALLVSPQNGLLADSVSTAVVTVSIYDEYNNPVPGKNVRVQVSGEKAFIKQPAAATDLNGESTAELRSTKPGFKVISASVLPENIALWDSVRVRFNEIAAAHMALMSGNNQTAPVNTVLPQPPTVQLLDAFGNPPKPSTVAFEVTSGGGSIIGYRNVTTDSKGQARVVWELGPTPGAQKLQASSANLTGSPIVFSATAQSSTAVDDNKQSGIPVEFALLQNAPNPFNPETNIYFDLPEASEVRVDLYDLNGRQIMNLFNGQKPAGRHHVRWQGRDREGRPLESGVYIYRLSARHGRSPQEFVAMRKLTLLK